MRFNFLKLLAGRLTSLVIRQNIVASFPAVVGLRDNIVSDDVTITSSLRSGVKVLGINFLGYVASKMSLRDGLRQKLRNCVNIF